MYAFKWSLSTCLTSMEYELLPFFTILRNGLKRWWNVTSCYWLLLHSFLWEKNKPWISTIMFCYSNSVVILCRVEYLVLDESDKLFELGLVEQVDLVVKACSNPSILRSLFSATLPDSVEELARTLMHDAVRVIIGRK